MKFRDIVEGKSLDPKDVVDYLVKTGVNPKDAEEAVKKGFGYANKKYGGATYKAALKKVAEVIWSLHESVECPECRSTDCILNESEYTCNECGEVFECNTTNEEVQGINETGVGAVITTTLAMVAQVHVWHLLVKSGQKHTALGSFYEELQSEVDELSERFIAQGGQLQAVNGTLTVDADYGFILNSVQAFRDQVSRCAAATVSPEMASILDGVVDIQECIDSFVYKFKLD